MEEEFDVIKSPDEIARILKVAVTLNIEIYCESTDAVNSKTIELDIRGVSGTQVVFGLKRDPGGAISSIQDAFPGGLKAGSRLEIIFGLVDGQYAIRDVLEDVSLSTFTVDAGRNMLRLQRRKDFRVSVVSEGLRFVQNVVDGEGTAEFKLLDLSAGGFRLLWPTTVAPVPAIGARFRGTLHLSGQKTAAVEIKLVKNHGADAPLKPELGYSLSFQFMNLSQEDSRAVLFACLFIHRSKYASR